MGEHTNAFIHANEPLGRRPVNNRGFVPPAMWVAVGDVDGAEKPARLAQRVDDDRRGFPDMLAAKKGEISRVGTIALYRVQDVVVLHAMGYATVEVFHAIGG